MYRAWLSFVPWGIFWGALYAGHQAAAGALAAAAMLIVAACHYKNPKRFELASLLFFALSPFAGAAPAFLLALSFLWASLLAFLPMLIGGPLFLTSYALDAAGGHMNADNRRTYDMLSCAWGAAFAASGVAALLAIAAAPAFILAIMLVATVPLASFGPLYFSIRGAARTDWAPPARGAKGSNAYEVIVAGSGIGGLAAASFLAKKGYRVAVFEQHSQAGGYCTSFERNGFRFNAGVESISGLHEAGPVTFLLEHLGLSRDALFVRNRERCIFRGEAADILSLDDYRAFLHRLFPGERAAIDRFLADATAAFHEGYAGMAYGVPLPDFLIWKLQGAKGLMRYPKRYPHLMQWMGRTYAKKLDEYFKDRGIKRLLSALSGYVGTPPERMDALSGLFAMLGYYIAGGWYPKGGAQRFADALAESVRSSGGEVFLNCGVTHINSANGGVTGVEAGGERRSAPVVISNINPKLMPRLMDHGALPGDWCAFVEGLEMSGSASLISLGVAMDLAGSPTLIKDLDNGTAVVLNSAADPAMAPAGRGSISLFRDAAYADFAPRQTAEYKRQKEAIAAAAIAQAERTLPGIAAKALFTDVATPLTFERYVRMPEGALYSFDQSAGAPRPGFKTPVRGLYLAGASTYPGGGIEAVVMSGLIAAHDIDGWKERRR